MPEKRFLVFEFAVQIKTQHNTPSLDVQACCLIQQEVYPSEGERRVGTTRTATATACVTLFRSSDAHSHPLPPPPRQAGAAELVLILLSRVLPSRGRLSRHRQPETPTRSTESDGGRRLSVEPEVPDHLVCEFVQHPPAPLLRRDGGDLLALMQILCAEEVRP